MVLPEERPWCVALGCVMGVGLVCRGGVAAGSLLVVGSELVDGDVPAGGGAAAADFDSLEVAVLDEVALGAADHRQAVVGEGGEFGAAEAVAELTCVVGDLGHDSEYGADGARGDAGLG